MNIIELHKKICAENETLGFKSDAGGGNGLSANVEVTGRPTKTLNT